MLALFWGIGIYRQASYDQAMSEPEQSDEEEKPSRAGWWLIAFLVIYLSAQAYATHSGVG